MGKVKVLSLIMHEPYEFIVTNEGIRYFSSEPIRLAYVVLLGVGGAIVAFGISGAPIAPGISARFEVVHPGSILTLGV